VKEIRRNSGWLAEENRVSMFSVGDDAPNGEGLDHTVEDLLNPESQLPQ
jgi:hypothetical protein